MYVSIYKHHVIVCKGFEHRGFWCLLGVGAVWEPISYGYQRIAVIYIGNIVIA